MFSLSAHEAGVVSAGKDGKICHWSPAWDKLVTVDPVQVGGGGGGVTVPGLWWTRKMTKRLISTCDISSFCFSLLSINSITAFYSPQVWRQEEDGRLNDDEEEEEGENLLDTPVVKKTKCEFLRSR